MARVSRNMGFSTLASRKWRCDLYTLFIAVASISINNLCLYHLKRNLRVTHSFSALISRPGWHYPLPASTMSSVSLIALLLASIASTSPLEPRVGGVYDCRRPTSTYNGYTLFPPQWPTCANTKLLTDEFGKTPLVKVQSDCDIAIDKACKAVNAMLDNGHELFRVKSVEASCQVDILFSQKTVSELTKYDGSSCVSDLQSISVDCMLIGTGKYAEEGMQAGVSNLLYDTRASTRDPPEGQTGNVNITPGQRFFANTKCGDGPAYMVGPTEYFNSSLRGQKDYGSVDAQGVNATWILEGRCLRHGNCAELNKPLLPFPGTSKN